MTLTFRNVDASPSDPVATWPYEALVTAIERGFVQDWKPIFENVSAEPWGNVARSIEKYLTYSESGGIPTLFALAVEISRKNLELREKEEVARRVREAIAGSGLTAAEFATRVGTSASRLSTYATGTVTPSAHMLLRIEASPSSKTE